MVSWFAGCRIPAQVSIHQLKDRHMKKTLYVFALAGLFGFASCDSPAEERAEEREETVEEMEDEAEEMADDMEEMEDTTAVIE